MKTQGINNKAGHSVEIVLPSMMSEQACYMFPMYNQLAYHMTRQICTSLTSTLERRRLNFNVKYDRETATRYEITAQFRSMDAISALDITSYRLVLNVEVDDDSVSILNGGYTTIQLYEDFGESKLSLFVDHVTFLLESIARRNLSEERIDTYMKRGRMINDRLTDLIDDIANYNL